MIEEKRDSLSPAQIDSISAIAYALGPLSLLGSAFVCACYLILKSKRTFGFQLVFLLSINDVFSQLRIIVQLFRIGATGDLVRSCFRGLGLQYRHRSFTSPTSPPLLSLHLSTTEPRAMCCAGIPDFIF